MIQQRKKDYLQRLIEEFFRKLEQAVNQEIILPEAEKEKLLNECFDFFSENFEVVKTDNAPRLIERIPDNALLEQYAKLLMTEYDISGSDDKNSLTEALSIVEYLQNTDTTYSWDRTVLREDILRRLDQNSH
jgi:cellulose biosynthesis protein BcsQ